MASGDTLCVFNPLSNSPPESDYATLDLRSGFAVLDMDDSAIEKASFSALLPSHYGGGQVKALVTWTSSTAISGQVKFRVEITKIQEGDNLDALPSVAGSIEMNSAAPATSGILVVAESSAMNAGGASPGDLLLVAISRLATDAADTLVGDTEILALELQEA